MVRGKSPPLRLGLAGPTFLPQSHKGYLFIDGIFEQRGMENKSGRIKELHNIMGNMH